MTLVGNGDQKKIFDGTYRFHGDDGVGEELESELTRGRSSLTADAFSDFCRVDDTSLCSVSVRLSSDFFEEKNLLSD